MGLAANRAADLLQHVLDTVLGFGANLGPGLTLEVQVALQNGVEDLLLALPPEGWHSTQQDIQDHPTAPDVCLVAVVSPQHLRWAHTQMSQARN